MTVLAYRGIGHPWTAAPGWDQLFLGADTREDLQDMIDDAASKFWKVWFLSEPTLKTHMFKPSGKQQDWQDIGWQGTPRGHGHQFKVGDKVYTDYGRRITHHEVVGIEPRVVSQTGIMLRVKPAPPGSVHVNEQGDGAKGLPWLDSAWFRKVI